MRRVDRLLGEARALRIARALVAQGKVHPTSGLGAAGKGASVEAAKALIAGLRRVSTPSILGLRPALPKKEKEARLAAGVVPSPDEPPRRDEVQVRLVDLIDDAPLDAFKDRACAMIVALMAEMGTSSLVARSCYARLADEFDPPAPYLPKRLLPERLEPSVSEPPVSGRSPDGLASGDPARVRALSCEDVGVLAVELALYEVCSMVMQANDVARPTRVTRRAEALAASQPVARRASRYDAPKDDAAKDDVARDRVRKGAAPQDVVRGPIDDAPRDDAPRDDASRDDASRDDASRDDASRDLTTEVARPNDGVNEGAAR